LIQLSRGGQIPLLGLSAIIAEMGEEHEEVGLLLSRKRKKGELPTEVFGCYSVSP
jgi:hypothetical protein